MGIQAYIKAFWNFSGTNTYKSALIISFPLHTVVLYSTFGHLKVAAALLYRLLTNGNIGTAITYTKAILDIGCFIVVKMWYIGILLILPTKYVTIN